MFAVLLVLFLLDLLMFLLVLSFRPQMWATRLIMATVLLMIFQDVLNGGWNQ